jgi:hypothetical protein
MRIPATIEVFDVLRQRSRYGKLRLQVSRKIDVAVMSRNDSRSS